MRLAKKGLGLLLTLILAITLIGVQNVSADNATVPDFTVKAVSKGTAAKVTIKKTAGAAGFEVYAYGKNIDDTPYNGDVDTSFGHVAEKVADIPKDGTAERTVTIKSLPAGNLKFFSVSAWFFCKKW